MKLVELQAIIKELTEIGRALSSEKDHFKIIEMILLKALFLTNADAGTLYIREGDRLRFEIMITKSLNLHIVKGNPKNEKAGKFVDLYNEKGQPNLQTVAPHAALFKKTINIKDAYKEKKFDLSGTFKFDKALGYRSQSFLTVPFMNHFDEVIGVLQLINAVDKKTGKIKPFSPFYQQVVESLASQAALTLTNQHLIEEQKALFDALIQLIAVSVDEKSPYTGGHCRRVPVLTRLLAEATCAIDKGPFKDFKMTDDEKYQLDVAAWLHDCGKITTPVHIIDKATKLETIVDRIEWIDTRFEVLKRDTIINFLSKKNEASFIKDNALLKKEIDALEKEREFLHRCNKGTEFMNKEDAMKIEMIAKHTWKKGHKIQRLLSEEEVENLKISQGTLSPLDRDIINRHVTLTLDMLKALPYPQNLSRVPEIAGAHHEKIDGTGYPYHLEKKEISIEARMLAIADIFEALTSRDRPYKKGFPLSKALEILGKMKVDKKIDADLFDVFMDAKVYETYAKEYLDETLIDNIDLSKIPGYKPLSKRN